MTVENSVRNFLSLVETRQDFSDFVIRVMNEKYNTFWRRFFAGIVDGIILSPIGWFLHSYRIDATAFLLFSTIFLNASIYTYSVWFHWKYGQTLGKRLMGVRVVDVSETRLLTRDQAFRRESIPITLAAIGIMIYAYQLFTADYGFVSVARDLLGSVNFIWFLLEIITMMTNDKRRAFHDTFARSVVVQDEYWHGTRENV
jgi:uncharacterized RDD family membrane protein YckC